MQTTAKMFEEALPRSEEDYSSERQIDAENAVYEAMEADGLMGEKAKVPVRLAGTTRDVDFETWALKATVEERMMWLRQVWRREYAEVAAVPFGALQDGETFYSPDAYRSLGDGSLPYQKVEVAYRDGVLSNAIAEIEDPPPGAPDVMVFAFSLDDKVIRIA